MKTTDYLLYLAFCLLLNIPSFAQNIYHENYKLIIPSVDGDGGFALGEFSQIEVFDNTLMISDKTERLDEVGQNIIQSAGAVYVYNQDSNCLWSFHQKIVAPNRDSTKYFGMGVDVFQDEAVILSLDSFFIYKKNSVGYWEYEQSGNTDWQDSLFYTTQVKLHGDYFVAVNLFYNRNHVYKKNDTTGIWSFHQYLIGDSNNSGPNGFSYEVDLVDSVLVVGIPDEEGTGSDEGAVYTYELDSLGYWQRVFKFKESGATNIGYSVATNGLVTITGGIEWPYLDENRSFAVLAKDTNGTWNMSHLSNGWHYSLPGSGYVMGGYGTDVLLTNDKALVSKPFSRYYEHKVLVYDVNNYAGNGQNLDYSMSWMPSDYLTGGKLEGYAMAMTDDCAFVSGKGQVYVFHWGIPFIPTLSVDEATTTLPSLQIYPNPAEDYTNIDLGRVYEDVHIHVYNLQGQLVLQTHEQQVDLVTLTLENMPTGMYQVVIAADDRIASQKLIIQ